MLLINTKIKVFNLKSRTNETCYISWHETYGCKCRLGTSVCNDRQRRNSDKCKCECKELIDKGKFDDGGLYGILVHANGNFLVHANENLINVVILVNTKIL